MLTQGQARVIGHITAIFTGVLLAATGEPWNWRALVTLVPPAIFYSLVVNRGVEPRQ
jgi:hypothetical protein